MQTPQTLMILLSLLLFQTNNIVTTTSLESVPASLFMSLELIVSNMAYLLSLVWLASLPSSSFPSKIRSRRLRSPLVVVGILSQVLVGVWDKRVGLLCVTASTGRISHQQLEFNGEIMERVRERLDEFLNVPVEACRRLSRFREMGGFPNGMTAADHKLIYHYLYSEITSASPPAGNRSSSSTDIDNNSSSSSSNTSSTSSTSSTNSLPEEAESQSQPSTSSFQLYFGLEDGTFFYYWDNSIWANYREPGNDGYRVTAETEGGMDDANSTNSTVVIDESDPNYKHWISCVNEIDGSPQNCSMTVGSKYVECVNDCELVPCSFTAQISATSLEDDLDLNTEETSTDMYVTANKTNISDNAEVLCPNYVIKQVVEGEIRGFVPNTDICVDKFGQPEQSPGHVLIDYNTQELGTCFYGDNKTPVNRTGQPSGAYAKCNKGVSTNKRPCNTAFVGGFSSYEYDPRYRDWYVETKQLQRPGIWTEPYTLFGLNAMGITYSQPLYRKVIAANDNDNKSDNTTLMDVANGIDVEGEVLLVFDGVVAVDYNMEQIHYFLVEHYSMESSSDHLNPEYQEDVNKNSTHGINSPISIHQNSWDGQVVFIVERKEPNYMIATSIKGSQVTKSVLTSDHSQPCPPTSLATGDNNDMSTATEEPECEIVRISIHDLGNTAEVAQNNNDDDYDLVLYRAFLAHEQANFPTTERVDFKINDEIGSKAYVAQGKLYQHGSSSTRQSNDSSNTNPQQDYHDSNLNWHVFVVFPMPRSTVDAAMPGSTAFNVTLSLGCFGFSSCLALFLQFYSKRFEKAIIYSDWRFTCAFILGCTALNLSTFTLLGENTDGTCMLRMWSFNMLFACALSPLFVKVWRMHTLLTAAKRRFVDGITISNAKSGMSGCSSVSSGGNNRNIKTKGSVNTIISKTNLTNFQSFLYTLPLVVMEFMILLIFSVVDPPRQMETLGVGEGGIGVQQVTCGQQTKAFYVTQLLYNGFLVFLGCVLAYKTKDLDPKFGEAKQLGFSMYNIAFTGMVIVAISNTVQLDAVTSIMLQAGGVLWGSFFCSFAFVLPRLLDADRDRREQHQLHQQQNEATTKKILAPVVSHQPHNDGTTDCDTVPVTTPVPLTKNSNRRVFNSPGKDSPGKSSIISSFFNGSNHHDSFSSTKRNKMSKDPISFSIPQFSIYDEPEDPVANIPSLIPIVPPLTQKKTVLAGNAEKTTNIPQTNATTVHPIAASSDIPPPLNVNMREFSSNRYTAPIHFTNNTPIDISTNAKKNHPPSLAPVPLVSNGSKRFNSNHPEFQMGNSSFSFPTACESSIRSPMNDMAHAMDSFRIPAEYVRNEESPQQQQEQHPPERPKNEESFRLPNELYKD